MLTLVVILYFLGIISETLWQLSSTPTLPHPTDWSDCLAMIVWSLLWPIGVVLRLITMLFPIP